MLDARANSKNAELLVAQLEPGEFETESDRTVGGKHMTDMEVIANSVLFFEAGYETTSTALGFVTHVLVNRQDIQNRMREEINQLIERQGQLDYNTVTELSYMEAVLFETMRMHPPITQLVDCFMRACNVYQL